MSVTYSPKWSTIPTQCKSDYLSIWNGCVYSDIRISQSGHLFLISSLHLCRSCNTDFAVVRSSPSLLMSLDILRAQVNFGAPRAIFSGLTRSPKLKLFSPIHNDVQLIQIFANNLVPPYGFPVSPQ